MIQTQSVTIGERDEDGAYREVLRIVVVREHRTGWWPDSYAVIPDSPFVVGYVPPPSEIRWERAVGPPRSRAASPSDAMVAPGRNALEAIAAGWQAVDEDEARRVAPAAVEFARVDEDGRRRIVEGWPDTGDVAVTSEFPSGSSEWQTDVTATRFSHGPAEPGSTAVLSFIQVDDYDSLKPGILTRFLTPQLFALAIAFWWLWRTVRRAFRERPVPRSEVDLPGWPGHGAEQPAS